MHLIQMKPIHQKNINKCLVYILLFFFVCVQHTYTQPVINQIDENKSKLFFFFFSFQHYQLTLFFFFIFLFICQCQRFLFRRYLLLHSFFSLCVSVGCNQFFSLAVCSFWFFCLFMCVVGIVCLM